MQLTSISHVEDVAEMMAAACNNENAIRQHYNACSDRTYTLDGIAHSVAKALGKEARIVHYGVKVSALAGLVVLICLVVWACPFVLPFFRPICFGGTTARAPLMASRTLLSRLWVRRRASCTTVSRWVCLLLVAPFCV